MYWWKSNRTFKYICNLKDKDENFIIKWSIAETASPYTSGTKWCDLCLTEKLLLAKADPETLLKQRSEACGVIVLNTHWDVYINCLNTRAISLLQGWKYIFTQYLNIFYLYEIILFWLIWILDYKCANVLPLTFE